MTRYPEPCPWAVASGQLEHNECQSWGSSCDGGGCDRKKRAAARRKAELAGYRKFPGNDLQHRRAENIRMAVDALGPWPVFSHTDTAPWDAYMAERQKVAAPFRLARGHCQWCEEPIVDHKKGGLNARRGWHDGRHGESNCLLVYYWHTRHPEQLAMVVKRDGTRCSGCGAECGAWTRTLVMTPERVIDWGGAWPARYPADIYAGPWSGVQVTARLEVDHIRPLALVALQIEKGERWSWFGPRNIWGLCRECHRIKTRADVAEIRKAQRDTVTLSTSEEN